MPTLPILTLKNWGLSVLSAFPNAFVPIFLNFEAESQDKLRENTNST